MLKVNVIYNKTVDYLFYVGCFIVFLSFAAVCIEVVVRTLLNVSFFWVTEFSEYCLVTSVCLGATWVLKKEGHVTLDTLISQFSAKKKAILNSITSLICAALCGIICWYGVAAVVFHARKATLMTQKSLELPAAPLISVVPLCFFLLTIEFIIRSYGFLKKGRFRKISVEKELSGL